MTKRKVRRFTAERRAAFLDHLRRSGNQKAAAASAGFDRTVPEQRRRRDAAFELECRAALAEASRRLAGASDPFAHDGDAAFETIRGGRKGRLQIVATRTGKWSKRAEELFLDILRGCGNVAAAARAAGFSEGLIWQRRRKWKTFAERMDVALEEAEVILEFRLATLGNDRCSIDNDDDSGTDFRDAEGAEPAVAVAAVPDADAPRFDPEFALRFLKWREEKRRGNLRAAGGRIAAPPDIEQVRASILRKIDAIERHDRPRLLAEGWTHDTERNHMIPPGWVRAAPGGGGAAEPGDGCGG